MNFLGDDIKLNSDGDMETAVGTGDFPSAEGVDCLLQDVLEEFQFPYLDDLDHPDRGNKFMQFVNSNPDDKITALEMKQEAKQILSRDPRINSGSISVEAEPGINGYIKCSFDTSSGTTVKNLVVPLSPEAQT